MEENRKFSWTDLFIKVILVIIFVLFTIWLLSLSNKGISNSLNVLTDDIFAKNIERMKEVGKEYFTTERLPEKIGDVKTITLEKMYDEKLLLELKDKHGNACSAKNSYVSIEKYETEYQMKVYLECGEQNDYIIVIMGCYDYCDTDICEKKDAVEDKKIEYEYKKTTGGSWTDYGNWSEWSKVLVTKTDYRQVETKVEKENYSYNKVITETLYEEINATCPSGYTKTSDGTKCYKTIANTVYADSICPSVSGYVLTNKDGFTCSYSKTTTSTSNPVCPNVADYTLVSKNGFTCNYSKTTTSTVDPECPVKDGWSLSRSGFTCNYSKKVTTSYQVPVRHEKTCYEQKVITSCTGCAPVIQNVPYDCSYTTYETRYSTTTKKETGTALCPEGYSQSENTCVKTTTDTTTKTATCPSGYTQSGNTCTKTIINTDTKSATCPEGYTKSGNTCAKTTTNTSYKNLIKNCPTDYDITSDGTKCYKNVESTIEVTETRDVTYYRYRVREYIGGSVDYKWSTSKEDKKLLDAGYVLTGRTR